MIGWLIVNSARNSGWNADVTSLRIKTQGQTVKINATERWPFRIYFILSLLFVFPHLDARNHIKVKKNKKKNNLRSGRI